jgi:molybdopterin-guanine dinucleotide biosynthesis protein A
MDSSPVTINCSGPQGDAKKHILARMVKFLVGLGVRAGILQPRISAAVLAGGNSSRLGRNKALLPLQGATVIEKVMSEVRSCVKELTIITNNPDQYVNFGYPCCGDIMPGGGPLSGIHAALSHCGTEYVLVVSCDIPLVKRELFEDLISVCPGYDIVIFKHKHFEPLCALYRRTCLPALEDLIAHGEYRIIDLFPTLKVKVLRISSAEVFKNINTDADYESVRNASLDLVQGVNNRRSSDNAGLGGIVGGNGTS